MKAILLILLMAFPSKITAPADNTIVLLYQSGLQDHYEMFTDHMALKESCNNWKAINKQGYIGMFQFGRVTLVRLGYGKITTERFRCNPKIFPPGEQGKAFYELVRLNEIDLQGCYKYLNTEIKGIRITKAGLLAGCHLGGLEGVKVFLATSGRVDRMDDNGTRISHYVAEFSKYEL